jgi:glycosyltransferase involved in cell wall biosynthesis
VIYTEATGAIRAERGSTGEIAKAIEFAIHDGSQERVGEGRARNEAIAKAEADWLFFLDADDLLLPGAVGQLISGMHGDSDLLYCQNAPANENETWRYQSWSEAWHAIEQREVPNLPVNVLVERERVRSIGGFDEILNWGAERDFVIRLAATGPVIGYLIQPIVHLRSKYSTRNLGPEFRVDPEPFTERIRSGYYLREVNA